MLPVEDPNQPSILSDYASAIRLSNFETSMQNQKEDLFSQMRNIFDKLLRRFLQDNAITQSFAQGIIQLISQVHDKIQEAPIRDIEFIYKMIKMLLEDSILFNSSSRHN